MTLQELNIKTTEIEARKQEMLAAIALEIKAAEQEFIDSNKCFEIGDRVQIEGWATGVIREIVLRFNEVRYVVAAVKNGKVSKVATLGWYPSAAELTKI